MQPEIRPVRSLSTILALTTTTALGVEWTVDDDGPADFATIQEAVDFTFCLEQFVHALKRKKTKKQTV